MYNSIISSHRNNLAAAATATVATAAMLRQAPAVAGCHCWYQPTDDACTSTCSNLQLTY
jgi:hypothetical protein